MKIEDAGRPCRGASVRRAKPGIGSCESPQGQTSNVPPAGRPQAHSAKRSQWPDWGLGICGPGSGSGVTTLRIGDRPRRDGCPAACRLQPVESETCETKPIASGAQQWARGDKPVPSVPSGHLRQTNPIPPAMPIWRSAVPGANCAKQTQFCPEHWEGQVLCG